MVSDPWLVRVLIWKEKIKELKVFANAVLDSGTAAR